jgi:hypothetical protein
VPPLPHSLLQTLSPRLLSQLACLVFLSLLSACRDHVDSSAPPDAGSLALDPLPPEHPGLTIRLAPRPDQEHVDVEIHVSGEHAPKVHELAVARSWAGTDAMAVIRDLKVRDTRGEIPTITADSAGPEHVFTLTRTPEGAHLAVLYRVASAPLGAPRFALRVSRERFSGIGHAFLILPRIEGKTTAHIQIRPNALAPGASGASSFAPEENADITASPDELAHAVYLAGRVRVLEKPPEARLVMSGRPTFDPTSALQNIARADTALRRVFGEPEPPVDSWGFGSPDGALRPKPQSTLLGWAGRHAT